MRHILGATQFVLFIVAQPLLSQENLVLSCADQRPITSLLILSRMSEAEKLLPSPKTAADDRQTHKRDVVLMIFISFISSVGFSIVLPSLAPFIAQVKAF